MPFEPIIAPNLGAAAAGQIRDLIAKDVLRPGDQLPGERDLSAQMGISRTSLRAGLQTLMAEGLLVSKHGSGLYVAKEIGRSVLDPLLSLIASSPLAISDYLSFRKLLESDSAAQVAAQATASERQHIDTIHTALQAADRIGDMEEATRLDTEFHMAIVEATGNVVSIQIARSLHELLQQIIRQNLAIAYTEGNGRDHLSVQHAAINDAIQAGDAEVARKAMVFHMEYNTALVQRTTEARFRREIIEKRQSWSEMRGN